MKEISTNYTWAQRKSKYRVVRDNTCLGSHKDKSVLKENDGFQQCHKEGSKWKPPP